MNSVQFTTYPNPVTDVLHIEKTNNMKIEIVEIIDASGLVRITQKVSNDENSISIKVQGLQQGIYYVRMISKDGNIASRIISKN